MTTTSELTKDLPKPAPQRRKQSPASLANLKPMTTGPGRCNGKCPGGERCTLSSDVGHGLHICADPECMCHSQERYEGRL